MKQFPGQRFICTTASASLEAERSLYSIATKGILKELFSLLVLMLQAIIVLLSLFFVEQFYYAI